MLVTLRLLADRLEYLYSSYAILVEVLWAPTSLDPILNRVALGLLLSISSMQRVLDTQSSSRCAQF